MAQTSRPPSIRLTAALAALIVIGSSGCDFMLGTDRPESARVVLDGTVPNGIDVVTSQEFFRGFSEDGSGSELAFLQADTASVTLPFDETYQLGASGWFAVRVLPPEGDTARVHLRVIVDGSERFNETATLAGQYIQYFMTHH